MIATSVAFPSRRSETRLTRPLQSSCGMMRHMSGERSVPACDEELVIFAQKGDRLAFEELMERHKQKAYHIAYDFARDRDDAKDLSQEAFLKAYTHIRNFDGRSKFYTWFYRILVNVCLDYKRRRRRSTAEPLEEASEGIIDRSHPAVQEISLDQQAFAKQLSRRVGAALEALPPKQRAAFILRNHHGMSIREIAETMEAAEGTVKVHLHRAVVALRESLAEFA